MDNLLVSSNTNKDFFNLDDSMDDDDDEL